VETRINVAADTLERWCCRSCGRPAIDSAPYSLDRKISPLATIGDLMGGIPLPSVWRPFARRRWIRRLEDRVLNELKDQRAFEARIDAALKGDT
jgi:hypothetical protein